MWPCPGGQYGCGVTLNGAEGLAQLPVCRVDDSKAQYQFHMLKRSTKAISVVTLLTQYGCRVTLNQAVSGGGADGAQLWGYFRPEI